VCVVLFVTGIASPAKSRRGQRKAGKILGRGERRSSRARAPLTDGAAKMFRRFRKATDASARAGRKTRAKARR